MRDEIEATLMNALTRLSTEQDEQIRILSGQVGALSKRVDVLMNESRRWEKLFEDMRSSYNELLKSHNTLLAMCKKEEDK